MKYPEYIIEEVRQQNDIVSLINEYTTLSKRGQSYLGLCPFHHEKTPSFSVSEDKQLYYCFGCGAGGNIITFLMNKENMSFIEAIRYLADRANIKLDESYLTEEEIERNKKRLKLLEILKEAARYFYHQLTLKENNEALYYLLNRGLTLETIKKFGLGYATNDFKDLYHTLSKKGYKDDLLIESGLFVRGKKNPNQLYDRFKNRIMYPIFDISQSVIAFGGRVLDQSMPKYLNSPENILFNKSHNLYGMQFAKGSHASYFILVEGYMDVIAMHQAGFSQTVASLGTALTGGHAKLLKRYAKEVVILYDSDTAGKNATLRAIPLLKKESLKINVLSLKEGKDPDEYLKSHGYEGMEKLLEQASSDIWFQVHMIEQNYHLERAEEKIKFLQEVAVLLGTLTSSIEQTIYLKEISEVYHADEEALKVEMNRSQSKPKLMKKQEKPIEKKRSFDKDTIFLADLYHYPALNRKVITYLKPDYFEGALMQDLAQSILDYLETGKEIDINYFTTHYPSEADQNIISRVLMYKDKRYEDTDLLKKALLDNIKRIGKAYIEKQLSMTQDVIEMQDLIFQKKVLDKLNIEAING